MRILILGGTVFLGYHLVQNAVKAGHDVTIFTRGKTNVDLFPEVEMLMGDRDGNLASLAGRRWDAVIDTSGYVPRVVRDSVKLLADLTEQYTFISSISVYRDFLKPGTDENYPVGELEDPSTEDVASSYGQLKALCEQEVEAGMPGRALLIRPGLIVGPQDPTDRFTYWPARISKGGSVLAPGHLDASVQFIDVRDLAEWTIRMVEARKTGVYNATGPDHRLTMQDLLEQCKEVTNSDAKLTWLSHDFLLRQGAGPWIELPLWIPGEGDTEKMAYMLSVNVDKAISDGLTFRSLAETIQDTLAWDKTRVNVTRKAGMTAEKESQLLMAWKTEAN
ncbi:SDR family oxidoreductase [Cohnella silvisoli]|uniref:SDR family oxidoreductase n=1 Tax=Cohnella silvisoli TaxID=2873699 RepID=A0ABV1KXZ5_9BACL|nr:SDR family oxidoreductase [Cohnella silvisoli]MCD9021840.1 SDR family oxidoreductase [Cohnella silvisoli]